MRQTLKATAAILALVAAVVLTNYILKAVGCLMIYVSETCNIPL